MTPPFTSRDLAPAPPLTKTERTYLTLDELETLCWEFREFGVSILAAGDEWHLVVPIKGVQTCFRAHRVYPIGEAS